jgi:hypothetical protein
MKCDSILIADVRGDEAHELPPRSHLYCLPLIGVGTAEVESATSYLTRLSVAHCVSTWSLLKYEIAPLLFGPDANLRNRLSELLAAMGSAFNGENDTSRKLVALLSSLTGRDDLGNATMGFCSGFVGPRFLVRVKQAWCGPCLSEWKTNGSEIYYPLLWHLMGVKACPRHQGFLATACPACNRQFHPLTAHSQIGFCPRCGHWLGTTANERVDIRLELATEVATAQRISDFLCNGPGKLTTASASVFRNNIEQLSSPLPVIFPYGPRGCPSNSRPAPPAMVPAANRAYGEAIIRDRQNLALGDHILIESRAMRWRKAHRTGGKPKNPNTIHHPVADHWTQKNREESGHG